ncbi:NAD(P)H-dependent oxidoreductase [Rheinheimera salexigens]|nr:NAD(P)H-dependent oxidoreductase [Rheinheimera salexigens]
MFSLLYAHPYGRHSYVNQHLIKAVNALDSFDLRDLYQAYPDFYINVKQEQLALQESALIIMQFPVQNAYPPSLLVQYINKVFCQGWAWGVNEQQQPTQMLANKILLVVLSGLERDDCDGVDNAKQKLQLVLQPLQHLAQQCGMQFAAPILLPLRHLLFDQELAKIATQYQQNVQQLLQQHILQQQSVQQDSEA